MAELFKNYIAGEWLAGPSVTLNRNPSDAERRHRRVRAGRRRTGTRRHRRCEEGLYRVVDGFDPGARQCPGSRRQRNYRPQGRTGRAPVARRRQDAARRRRRGDARRPDLRVLRRRSGAHDRRQAAIGASRRRRGSDARTAWRDRPHHAVEFSDCDSRMEDRAGTGVRQHGGVQAGRPGARMRVGHCRYPGRAGLPAGVFNLVMGRGSVVGADHLNSPDVTAISFTGSVGTGRAIAERPVARMAKIQLEMGGKNPPVVLDDADLPKAVNVAVQGAFFSTGQRCTASSRLIVTAGIHDRFVAALTEKLKSLKVDNALLQGHRHWPRGRPEPTRAGPEIPRHRQGRGCEVA